MIKLHVHAHAEMDLDRHFTQNEAAVGYLDTVIALISEQEKLQDKLTSERYEREYDQPIGLLGMETKRIGSLWQQNIRALRIRLDNDQVAHYRIIYTVLRQKQANQSYEISLWILAVIHKDIDQFDYQTAHPIMERVKNDYANLNA
nr:MAG TPA: hypothetical protein [Bacteriophage sp.]